MDETENDTIQPTQITPQSGSETHYQSSQSVTGSSQSRASTTFTMAESQQVISVTEARMSELIEGRTQTEHLLARNPIKTQPIAEELAPG